VLWPAHRLWGCSPAGDDQRRLTLEDTVGSFDTNDRVNVGQVSGCRWVQQHWYPSLETLSICIADVPSLTGVRDPTHWARNGFPSTGSVLLPWCFKYNCLFKLTMEVKLTRYPSASSSHPLYCRVRQPAHLEVFPRCDSSNVCP
jgi:hypothetical protein